MRDVYTEDLGRFGSRERKLAAILLSHDLPDNFSDDNVRLAMNNNSGYVFLVNDDCQCAMMNGDTLEIFHSLPYGGEEGFLSDIVEENTPGDLHHDDVRYVRDAAESEGLELPESWNVA